MCSLEPPADKKLSTLQNLYRFALFLTSVAILAGVTILNLTIFWLSSNPDSTVTTGVPLVSEITVFLLPCLGVFLLSVGFLIGLSRLKSKHRFSEVTYSNEELVEGALKHYVHV